MSHNTECVTRHQTSSVKWYHLQRPKVTASSYLREVCHARWETSGESLTEGVIRGTGLMPEARSSHRPLQNQESHIQIPSHPSRWIIAWNLTWRFDVWKTIFRVSVRSNICCSVTHNSKRTEFLPDRFRDRYWSQGSTGVALLFLCKSNCFSPPGLQGWGGRPGEPVHLMGDEDFPLSRIAKVTRHENLCSLALGEVGCLVMVFHFINIWYHMLNSWWTLMFVYVPELSQVIPVKMVSGGWYNY